MFKIVAAFAFASAFSPAHNSSIAPYLIRQARIATSTSISRFNEQKCAVHRVITGRTRVSCLPLLMLRCSTPKMPCARLWLLNHLMISMASGMHRNIGSFNVNRSPTTRLTWCAQQRITISHGRCAESRRRIFLASPPSSEHHPMTVSPNFCSA